MGRQARVKVKEGETRLVLLQVRHKVSGGFVDYGVRRDMAEAHGVAALGGEQGGSGAQDAVLGRPWSE